MVGMVVHMEKSYSCWVSVTLTALLLLGIFPLWRLPCTVQAAESSFSDQQLIQLSEMLHNKEKTLQEKESLLQEKEKRLILLQKELQKKEKEIEAMRRRAEASLAEFKALKDEDLSRLVAVYSAMKPAAAAPLMAKLDLPYAVEVILRMQPRKAAKLLSAIEPKRAAAISRSITMVNAGKGK